MTSDTQIRSVNPAELEAVRVITHRAVQHLGKAASANLPAQSDGSHSSFRWDSNQLAFLTQPMGTKSVGLSINPLTLFLNDNDQRIAELALNAISDAEVATWLDQALSANGLQVASNFEQPFELPADVLALDRYGESRDDRRFAVLAAWLDVAAKTLSAFASAYADLRPGPSPVRCWPHHFDIATYVALETGDPETARGVGVGLSPGDEGYNEPYIYVNPWPHLDADALPKAISPGHWHTEGYVGLIATATEMLGTSDVPSAMDSFVVESFSTARRAHGL